MSLLRLNTEIRVNAYRIRNDSKPATTPELHPRMYNKIKFGNVQYLVQPTDVQSVAECLGDLSSYVSLFFFQCVWLICLFQALAHLRAFYATQLVWKYLLAILTAYVQQKRDLVSLVTFSNVLKALGCLLPDLISLPVGWKVLPSFRISCVLINLPPRWIVLAHWTLLLNKELAWGEDERQNSP